MPIFDQGYQHWSGTLTGHAWRWLTITRQGIRVGMKNILLRILIIVSWLPAAFLAFLLCLWGLLENKSPYVTPLVPFLQAFFPKEVLLDPRHYRVEAWTICFSFFLKTELYFSMIVVLLVGPGLISQDLRFNALPLYFSRPLRRIDYFVGKMGVIAWFLGMVIVLPSLLAYVLGLLFSLDITILWDTFPLLLACLAYGAVIILSAGALMLAFSSLTRNSRYVALIWVAVWFVTSITANILDTVATEQRRSEIYRKQAVIRHDRQPHEGPMTQAEMRAEQQYFEESYRKSQAEFQEAELRASQTNWRLLPSYTANLSRVGQMLLRTDAAWQELSKGLPAQERDDFLATHLGPQYPWFWSAIVLTVLFGLSACILNFRIRSLDRLK
jgi:ABC-2 type transport system permease protein